MRKAFEHLKRLLADSRGQAIIEYVIIAAVLCLVLGATMPDFVDTLGDAYIESEETIVDPPEETDPVIPDTFYTVKYDANGGTNAPEMQVKKPGVSLTLSVQIPNRSDYTFQGWSLSKDRADNLLQDYQPGDTYVKDESVILYASWLDNHRQYEMRFHTNPPAGSSAYFSDNTTLKTAVKYHNTPAAIIPDIPTCTYYSFLGWNESATAAAATYTKNDIFNENRDVDFYAVWQEIPYTVTYYANGGTGSVPASSSYKYGTKVTVQKGSLTKAKMQFVGWSVDSIKTTVDYKAGSTFTMPHRNVKLYAVYMPTDFHTTVQTVRTAPTKRLPHLLTEPIGSSYGVREVATAVQTVFITQMAVRRADIRLSQLLLQKVRQYILLSAVMARQTVFRAQVLITIMPEDGTAAAGE